MKYLYSAMLVTSSLIILTILFAIAQIHVVKAEKSNPTTHVIK